VDWSAVLAELNKTTPTGLSLTTFTGSANGPTAAATPAGGSASASTTPTTTPTTAATGTPTTAAVGSLQLTVGGTFPPAAHFSPVAEWIDNITGASMFDPPGVSAVTNQPLGSGTAVAFTSTLSLTSGATLAKNGRY